MNSSVSENKTWIKISPDLAVRQSGVLRFRGVMRLERVPVAVGFSVAATAAYSLYINGQIATRGPLPGGQDFVYRDVLEDKSLLKRGVNVIGIEMQAITAPEYELPFAVNVQAVVETRAGEEKFSSDSSWTCSEVEHYEAPVSDGPPVEVFTGLEKSVDWHSSRISAKGWSPVVCADDLDYLQIKDRPLQSAEVKYILPAFAAGFNSPERPKDAPFEQALEMAVAADLNYIKNGSAIGLDSFEDPQIQKIIKTPRNERGVSVVMDFDEKVLGKLRLGLETTGSGVVDVFFSNLQAEEEGVPVPDAALGMIRINLKKGTTDLSSRITRSFRFIQIDFRKCTQPVELKYVDIETVAYPQAKTAMLDSNRRMLNEIWQQSVSELGNMLGGLSTGACSAPKPDLAAFASISGAAFYAFGNTLLSDYLLDSLETWCSDALDAPEILVQYTELSGNSGRLRELYKAVKMHVDRAWSLRNSDGLVEIEGKVLALPNIKLCRALENLSVGAWLCGREDDAYLLSDQSVQLRKAIKYHLFDDRRGLYCIGLDGWKKIRDYPLDVNIAAAGSKALDQYERSRVYHWLRQNRSRLSDTQLGELVWRMVLDKRLEEALDVMVDYIQSPATSEYLRRSMCALFIYTVSAHVIGLKRVMGMQGRYALSPSKLSLKQVDITFSLPEGDLVIGWRSARHGNMLNITVPEGARVDVYLGSDFGQSFRLDGRMLVNGCSSLVPGTYRISCSESGRRLHADRSLLPEVPWMSVEVLEGVSQMGITHGSGRRDHRRKKDDAETNTTPNNAIETVEQVDVVPVDPFADVVLDMPAGELSADAKPKRRRRPRKKRPADQETQPESGDSQVESTDNPAEPKTSALQNEAQPEEVEAEAAPVETKSKRRRGRRGRRKPAGETVETEGAEVTQSEEVTVSTQPAANPAQAEVPEQAPEELDQSSETADSSPRPSRRRRRPKKHHPAESTEQNAVPEDAEAPPSVAAENVEAVTADTPVPEADQPDKPKPTVNSRRRGTRKASPKSEDSRPQEQSIPNQSQQKTDVDAKSEVEPAAEASPKPARRPPRKKPEQSEQPEQPQLPNIQATDQPETPAPAKRRRSPRPRPPAAENDQSEQ